MKLIPRSKIKQNHDEANKKLDEQERRTERMQRRLHLLEVEVEIFKLQHGR